MSTGVVPEAIRDAAYDAAVLSCGILISESLTEFSTDPKQAKKLSDAAPDAKAAMDELLTACAEKAPQLLKEESFVLPLARLSAWAPAADWVRPLDDWSCDTSSSAAGALRSLEEHLLETYESPKALHTAVAHRPPEGQCTENAHRIACAFTRVLADAGAGRTSVRAALQREVCPGITKRMAKEFVQLDPATAASARCAAGKAGSKGSDENPPGAQVPLSPLHALREAQVLALGGDAWVVRAACAARMGSVLGTAMEEEFCLTALMWLCTHQEELDEIAQATTILDYFCEMHAADGDFAVAGRTVKRVLEAIEQYALSTITFDNDEQFQGNPKGLTGMFMENATIPAGTKLAVPYDEPAYGGHGTYKLGGEGQRGSEPVTVRIAEIKSLKRLVYEGQMLNNCLENKFSSQVKYVQRARQRVSSFWSLTYARPGEKQPEHKALIEVWHLREGNIIRQAEGPRPRTIPAPDAFYWIDKWCDREDVDLSTWDCYSRLEMPIVDDEFASKGRI